MNTSVSNNLSFLGSVGAASVLTSQTTSSTSYTDLATSGPAVTVTTLTSAIVTISLVAANNTINDGAIATYAVSGATTVAAADGNGYTGVVGNLPANGEVATTTSIVVTGLTAGSNTFTVKYRANVGGTATFLNRFINVEPLTT